MRNLVSSVMANLALAILLAGSASAHQMNDTQPRSLVGLRRVVEVPPWIKSQHQLKDENFGVAAGSRGWIDDRSVQGTDRSWFIGSLEPT